MLAGTYGLLVTTNGGADFYYDCESEIFGKPPGTYTMDPLLELGPGGAILTGSRHSVRVSRDRGCTFETEPSLPENWAFFEATPPAGAETGQIVDVCRRGAGEAAPVLALVAMLDEQRFTTEHRLYESDATGAFHRVGAALPPSELDFGLTLDAAPSDPDRLYVSGTLANDPVLLVSDDGGARFHQAPLVLEDPESVLGAYLGGVSPTDADQVYLRVARRVLTTEGRYERDDSLVVSRDGGDSFEEVLREPANLLGFAISLDGTAVAAGYGDPRADETISSPDAVGLYWASTSDLAFEHAVTDLDVSCLRFAEQGLYACALERDPLGAAAESADFHLGLYAGSGAPASVGDFSPLLKLRDVRGPAPFEGGESGPCAEEWQSSDPTAPVGVGLCAQLNACGDEKPAPSPGALVCGTAPNGGEAGAQNGAAGAPNGSAGAPNGATSAADGGCSCRTARRPAPNGAVFTLLLLLFVTRSARRARSGAGFGGRARGFPVPESACAPRRPSPTPTRARSARRTPGALRAASRAGSRGA